MSSPAQAGHQGAGLQRTVLHVMERLAASTQHTALGEALASCVQMYAARAYIEKGHAAKLHSELEQFIAEPQNGQSQRFRARLIQQHLLPYLPESHPNLTASDKAMAPPIVPALQSPQQSTMRASAKRGAVVQLIDEAAGTWSPEQDTWWILKGALEQITGLKREVADHMQTLHQQRDELTRKLDDTSEQVKSLELEGDALRSELQKARQQVARKPVKFSAKAAKKWNALPKQPTLLKQLQIEIERAKRSRRPLSLAHIAIDGLEHINAEHGEEISTSILACYATEVLSGFRIYDIVARYDAEDIAVILPDTDAAGAQRALDKARNRAGACYMIHDGSSISLPGFSAAVTEYLPGEELSDLLARADSALAEAQAAR